jgi:hypothetical protein
VAKTDSVRSPSWVRRSAGGPNVDTTKSIGCPHASVFNRLAALRLLRTDSRYPT